MIFETLKDLLQRAESWPPKDLADMDMTCELQDEAGKCVSERWVYLWKKTH